mmetsp:Transcript_36813/g.94138  ORF Transcript_36813/g.94138 Transcript_36813/m.94138 type:complete len:208 (-) Transcript_36813:243-866(-)
MRVMRLASSGSRLSTALYFSVSICSRGSDFLFKAWMKKLVKCMSGVSGRGRPPLIMPTAISKSSQPRSWRSVLSPVATARVCRQARQMKRSSSSGRPSSMQAQSALANDSLLSARIKCVVAQPKPRTPMQLQMYSAALPCSTGAWPGDPHLPSHFTPFMRKLTHSCTGQRSSAPACWPAPELGSGKAQKTDSRRSKFSGVQGAASAM